MAGKIKLGYTTIMHEPRIRFGLSMNDYAIASMVYHLSNNPKAPIKGWCITSKEDLGSYVGLSRRGVQNIVKELINIGLLEQQPETFYLRTTEEWYENFECFTMELGSAHPAQTLHTPEEEAEVSTPEPGAQGAQTLHTPAQTMHTGGAQTMPEGCANYAHNKDIYNYSFDNKIYKDIPTWFLKIFNLITKKSHRKCCPKTLLQLTKAVKNGYKTEDLVLAVQNASISKYHLETNYEYLTPEFITRPDKLEMFISKAPQPHASTQQHTSQGQKQNRTADSGGKKSFD